jgi:hypothetical protein
MRLKMDMLRYACLQFIRNKVLCLFSLFPLLSSSPIFSRSLQAMCQILRRDIYSLRAPGIFIDQVNAPSPDPLATVRYSCHYWVDHLLDCGTRDNTIDNLSGSVFDFLRRSFLYWLEALSLIDGLSDSILMIRKLESWLQVSVYIH